ncbi:hypothetical protein B566_EDAN000642 [Ephemera danica]|nr:hypothetical protein B566_EDAN000642 [Ephemera danica]
MNGIKNEHGVRNAFCSDKVRRLEAIRLAILNSTGRTERPIGTAPSSDHANTYQVMMEQFIQKMMPWASMDGFTERVQSFYPVCVPLHKPTTTPAPLVTVLGDQAVASTLQPAPPPPPVLPPTDEMSLENQNQSNSNAVTPCTTRRTAESLEAVAKAANTSLASLPLQIAPVGLSEPYVDDDRRIRVSVYYYIRSQRKNKLRRKLLDTKMVPMLGDEWVDLNVRAAARLWRNESKNLGLVIEVEDEEGKQQAASRFFNDMNCSKEASTSRPIPSFLMDAVREKNGHQNASLHYNSDLFPVIDLCTMDIPKHDKMNKPVVAMVSDQMTPITPPYHSVIDSHHNHGTHQHGNGFNNNNNPENNKGTAVLQNPFYRIYEMQRAHRLPVPQIRVPDEEENSEPIVQEQKLQDDPTLRETQLEQQQQQQQSSLHPHRHHKKHHLTHSHEDFGSKDRRHDDVEETTDYDQEASSSVRRPHHQKHHPYQLHHNFHHHGHHVHPGEGDTTSNDSGEDDWNGKAIRTLVVVPASQFLDLATQLESESQQQQHHKKRRQQRHDDYER